MLNLYWRTGEQTRSLIEEPFKSETELEEYVFANQLESLLAQAYKNVSGAE